MSSDQRGRPAENPKIGNLMNSSSGHQFNETATGVDASTLRSGPSRGKPGKPSQYGQTA